MIFLGSGSETNPSHRLITILDRLGYLPATSKVDTIIYTSIINSINELGKSYSKAILSNMCSLSGFSEMELLTNYDLFESYISKILGKAANPILFRIKKEVLVNAVMNKYSSGITESDILDKSLTVNDIINRMRLDEVCELVQNLRTAFSHTIFFYRDIDIRDKVLSSVLASNNVSNAQEVVFSSECNSRWQSLISSSNLNSDMRVTLAKSRTKLQYPETPRYMVTTTTAVDGESSQWPSSQHDNASIPCECDITKLTSQNCNTIVESMVASHDYVLIDEPIVMYESRNMRKKKMSDCC